MNGKNPNKGIQHGIGLHFVRRIVLVHKGKISITSNDGAGFRVEVTF